MLYIAFFKIRPGFSVESAEIIEKSHKWWDGGAKPAGLKTIGVFGCLGTGARDVLVFEAQSHDDIREMVNFWRDTTFRNPSGGRSCCQLQAAGNESRLSRPARSGIPDPRSCDRQVQMYWGAKFTTRR